MNGPHTTNPLAESQPDADSQPPDPADQRCVARDHCHAVIPLSPKARRLDTNKAATAAFIDRAEMRCKTTAELVFDWLCAPWKQCRFAKVWIPSVM